MSVAKRALKMQIKGLQTQVERLRDLSHCPPDGDLDSWIKMLVGCWERECQNRQPEGP